MTSWLAIRYVHVIAMAFFLGGQLLLAVAVVPVERAHPDRDRLPAATQVRSAQKKAVGVAGILRVSSQVRDDTSIRGGES